MEIAKSPFQISTYRGEQCILRSQADATLSRGQRDDATVWRFGAELDGDDALHGGGETSGDLERSGALFVSDAPASRALRTEKRRVGTKWVVKCRTRGSPDTYKNNTKTIKIR